MNNIKKITYKELKNYFILFNKTHNHAKEAIKGVIVFTEDSFDKEYSLESRSYVVSSNCKAFIPSMNGYSIFGSSLDGIEHYVRLEQYMKDEYDVEDGWKVDYCYLCEDKKEDYLLKLEIKTGGAAFGEDDELSYEGRYELARLLRKVALEIENDCNDGVLMDINGNKVGKWNLD